MTIAQSLNGSLANVESRAVETERLRGRTDHEDWTQIQGGRGKRAAAGIDVRLTDQTLSCKPHCREQIGRAHV